MRGLCSTSVIAMLFGLGLSGAVQAQTAFPASNPNAAKWAMIKLTPSLVTSALGGKGVKIGLYDGTADCSHPELVGRCSNVLDTTATYGAFSSHGTHTAGTLVGKTYGIAKSATVIDYAVFDDKGYVATGLKRANLWKLAAANGASIASMSLGCVKKALCFTDTELSTVASRALSGTLFVKAAGNDGAVLGNELTGLTASAAATAMSRIILVGSVNSASSPSGFSNQPGEGCLLTIATTVCAKANQWKYHFLYAPGEMLVSAQPGNKYAYMSGTSMATPIVAASAALMQARWPALKAKPATVASILFSSATDLGAPGVDSVYGWGLLNITKAFQNSGTTVVMSASGVSMTVSGTSLSASPVMGQTAALLGTITAYDAYGRDYRLSEVSNLRLERNLYTRAQGLGSPLAMLEDQASWSADFFAPRTASAWAGLGPDRAAFNAATDFDQAFRLGLNMPVGAGGMQLRLTGLGHIRRDLARDTALRPLSYFASSALLNQSGLMGLSWPVSASGQVTAFAAASTPKQVVFGQGDISQPYRLALNDPTRLDLERSPRKQASLGAGYWYRLDAQTVVGISASIMHQRNSFYDLTSDLAAFAGPNQVYNLGGLITHKAGPWTVFGAGELSTIKAHRQQGPLQYSDASLVSAELGISHDQVFARAPGQSDQVSLGLVLAPQAVSGRLSLSYLTQTPDGLDRIAVHRAIGLDQITGRPVRLETRYQFKDTKGWSMALSAGLGVTGGTESSVSAEVRRRF